MSDKYYASRFAPFQRSLKSKFNLVILVLGLVILVDWMTGGPLAAKLMLSWYDLKGVDVHAPKFTILSVFGAYRKVNDLALAFDKFLSIFFLAVAALSYTWGLAASLINR